MEIRAIIPNPPYHPCDTRPPTHLQAHVAQRRDHAGLLPSPFNLSVAIYTCLLNLVALKRFTKVGTVVTSHRGRVIRPDVAMPEQDWTSGS
ncbi:hypothetical protein GJ744_004401 [Endocarpon pusillum]|uniref:Uncharacterized protein n=1 Tax=Endocarpon pusillum TaxID=364733 RepID=A0A8H7EBT2_9EURO|nr:hypothetical protein GJ744_004401 [Endocarpon pusillum]